uniref:Uncharacterized protein n=1 Tax=Anguilla anguilla TaxID=7936 RepID=A0A0E9Q936_ANGAN
MWRRRCEESLSTEEAHWPALRTGPPFASQSRLFQTHPLGCLTGRNLNRQS